MRNLNIAIVYVCSTRGGISVRAIIFASTLQSGHAGSDTRQRRTAQTHAKETTAASHANGTKDYTPEQVAAVKRIKACKSYYDVLGVTKYVVGKGVRLVFFSSPFPCFVRVVDILNGAFLSGHTRYTLILRLCDVPSCVRRHVSFVFVYSFLKRPSITKEIFSKRLPFYRTATDADIKKSYRKLALQFHPGIYVCA